MTDLKSSPDGRHRPKSETGGAGEPQITRARFTRVFIAVALPMFLSAVDQTLLATSTPAIAAELGGLRDTSWISIAYLLSSVVIVPVYGRLGDALGRKKVLLTALGVFSLGAVVCSLAQTLPQLIAGRIVQGLGGGGLMNLSQSVIGELIPPRQRVKFQAYFAAVFSSSSIAGPVIGGMVVSYLNWRWLFIGYLPLVAFAAWRLWLLPQGERNPGTGARADVAGIVLFGIAIASSLYWLTQVGHHFAWASPASLLLLALAAGTGIGLAWQQMRHRAPFLPVDLLRNRTILLLMISAMLFSAAMFAMVFFLPIYLQLGHGLSARNSGFLLLPLTAGTVFGSALTGRVAARTGETKLMHVSGLTIGATALMLMSVLPDDPRLFALLGLLAGGGFGTVMPTTQVVSQAVAGRAKLAAVGSLVTVFRSFGAALGTALVGAVLYALIPDVDVKAIVKSGGSVDLEAIRHAFHVAFLLAAILAGSAAFTASRVPRVTLQ